MSTAAVFNAEYVGYGPRDLTKPVCGKMSGVPGPITKKRKKTDAKPQSQINKCLNEKRRREQENIYIEELAELISASFADMNSLSVKPDKCAILQETVNQIRHIKQQEHCGGDAAVQQGEVSSSNPTVLRNEVFGPLLLEALDGFLFVVNLEGRIEFVTENVHQFIKYTRDDVSGKSIYNFIHHGDHARFSSSLLPISIGWPPEPSPQHSRKTFECRLLVKPPDDQESTMEEKQQRVSKYENMQIQCTQVQLNRDKNDGGDGDDVTSESGDVNLSLMCVARRMPQNEKAVGTPIEQFSMKLDTSGKIIGIDTFGVSAAYSQYLNKDLMGQIVQEMCHPGDLPKLNQHLKDTLTMGTATSAVYRLRVGSPDKFVRVKTVSKLFKTNVALQEPDFIMATHSIIGDLDVSSPESAVTSPACSTSVGGPLMSGSNGSLPLGGGAAQNNFSSYELSLPEFDFFPTSTWDASEGGGGGDSRSSLTPRPPSVPEYSPTPAHAFPFSPIAEEEKEAREEPQESGRLRNLLTQRGSIDEDEGDSSSNKHRILKGLLNQDEEEPSAQSLPNNNNNNNHNNMLLKLLNEKSDDDDLESRAGLKKQNELLQQLLKEQNDDRKQTAINSQQEDTLLKSLGFRNPTPSPPTTDGMSSLIGNRKRPSDEGDNSHGPGGKRPPDASTSGQQVTSSGNSKLWEKNKMLASLLAKEPPKGTTIPPIPTSVISATPQDKLPKIGERLKAPGGPWSAGSLQGQSGGLPGGPGRPPVMPGPHPGGKPTRVPGSQFLNQILAAQQNDPQSMHLAKHIQNNLMWETQSSDPVLSDLLDQVIDIVPDAVCSESSQLMSLLDQMDQAQPPNQTCYQQDQLQERMAINAIQKSLMLCETAVKSPSSPTTYSSAQGQPAGFPPPPVYQQVQGQRIRFANTRGGQPFPLTPQQQQQQALLQRKMLAEQQKQQKQRLLQAQQQQHLLIPSNATADSAGLSNIDSLLNNTVAPNVTLQRSPSVSETQLSPGFSNQMLSNGGPISTSRQPQQQQQQQPSSQQQQQQQPPYSPHSPQGWGHQQAQARLSPHPQSQLSPRITQGQPNAAYAVTTQGQQAAQSPVSWQQTNRLTMQQQQNPMLNAQLTGGYSGGGGGGNGRFATPGRALASPGPGARQSPFPPEAFPPPVSPTGYQPSPSPYNSQQSQQQQMRLQRSISTPTATTQLPGGPAGPRHYGLGGKEMPRPPHLPYPSYPSHPCPSPEHMLYHPPPPLPPPPDMQYYDQMYVRAPPHQSAEYVRQELRAVVGARTQQLVPPASPRQQQPQQQQQQQQQQNMQPSVADFEALGLTYEMPSGSSESPKMWVSMGADVGASSPQSGLSNRTNTMEDTQRVGEQQKSSLLQKLLSE